MKNPPPIVLAAFGTTDVEAMEAILNVEKRIRDAFPAHEVHLAFTSNMIRKIWHQRANDQNFKDAHPELPQWLYSVTNPLTTLALIQEKGFTPIWVQSLHITNGSELDYVQSMVTQLAGITALQPSKINFPYLDLGDSALGDGSPARLKRAAQALKPLVEEAKSLDSALLFMGHGNDHLVVEAYEDFAKTMSSLYNYPVFMGLVEGNPNFDEVLSKLKDNGVKKIFLTPLMLVAGDHAKNDMSGDDDDSWEHVLQAEGFTVTLKVKGLGLLDGWADIYVERLKEVEAKYHQNQ